MYKHMFLNVNYVLKRNNAKHKKNNLLMNLHEK